MAAGRWPHKGNMKKSLVIVESPTKARTIRRFLTDNIQVLACMGHVRDLPQRTLGVDINENFKPKYVLTTSGRKTLSELTKAVSATDKNVYLATDPDREGEAIAWHLHELLKEHTKAEFQRISFHEITRSAIQHALDTPATLDMHKVDAQQARRILDRIVGYKVSPLLWKHVKKGTSAGRVQSVALRLVCEREREIIAFTPEEYWNLTAKFQPLADPQASFVARLFKVDNEKPQVGNEETAKAMAGEMEKAEFAVANVGKREKRQRPAPPFITSSLQQTAGNRLRFSARQTMQVAQQLYEGVETGSSGAVGLITYMRTDSVQVAAEAQQQTLAFIRDNYGDDYAPAKPNFYRSRESAQGAHEAIRPTDVSRTPDAIAKYLTPQQLRLYRLIWTRFVASQMTPARLMEHTIDVGTTPNNARLHDYLFRALATATIFPGYLSVYRGKENEALDDDAAAIVQLPPLKEGDNCLLEELLREQKFTEPPRRFSEASLVRELEQNGVGRPSTYASIVDTIQRRDYVKKEKSALVPTTLGFSVNDYLVNQMPELFQVSFTAEMEARLDQVEEGKIDYTRMLDDFYEHFRQWTTEIELVPLPANDQVSEFIKAFPDNIQWEPPQKKGRTVFDDRRFFESLCEQHNSGKKLSDKQWRALLGLAARYAEQMPELTTQAQQLGIEKEMTTQIEQAKQEPDEAGKAFQPKPSEETMAYINALTDIKWAPPQKSGKKTYDDHAFYTSLKEQVEKGRALSSAQLNAIRKMVMKYQGQIADFTNFAENWNLKDAPGKEKAEVEVTKPLLALLANIKTWQAPRKSKGRTFDDQEFATSLQEQFTNKGNLSVRQVEALRRMLAKYHDQIPDYAEKATTLGLPPKDKAGATDAHKAPDDTPESSEKCPECGATLRLRHSRRGPFHGCAAYPKCRFTKPA